MKRIFLALSLTVAIAHAETPKYAPNHFVDGNKLLRWCEESPKTLEGISCSVYLQGLSDALEEARAELGVASCTPAGTETSQLRDIVVRYLKDHAQWRQWSAATLASAAIAIAWCPDKAKDVPQINDQR